MKKRGGCGGGYFVNVRRVNFTRGWGRREWEARLRGRTRNIFFGLYPGSIICQSPPTKSWRVGKTEAQASTRMCNILHRIFLAKRDRDWREGGVSDFVLVMSGVALSRSFNVVAGTFQKGKKGRGEDGAARIFSFTLPGVYDLRWGYVIVRLWIPPFLRLWCIIMVGQVRYNVIC